MIRIIDMNNINMKKILSFLSQLVVKNLPMWLMLVSVEFQSYLPDILYPEIYEIEICLIIVWLGFGSFRGIRASNRLSSGENIPTKVIEHPVHQTSEPEYEAARQKMEEFIIAINEDKSARVEVTADDINSLLLEGRTPIRTDTYFPRYYEILDDSVRLYVLEWNPLGWSEFKTFICDISFKKQETSISIASTMISKNEIEIPHEKQVSEEFRLIDSQLLKTMLMFERSKMSSKQFKSILKKIENVEIDNRKLILSA